MILLLRYTTRSDNHTSAATRNEAEGVHWMTDPIIASIVHSASLLPVFVEQTFSSDHRFHDQDTLSLHTTYVLQTYRPLAFSLSVYPNLFVAFHPSSHTE